MPRGRSRASTPAGSTPSPISTTRPSLILSWASNVLSTSEEGQIASLTLEQLKNGAKLIVVDPRRTDLADRADLWLQLRPGTAQALALGFLHVIIEESLYDKEFVEKYTYGFEDLARHVKALHPGNGLRDHLGPGRSDPQGRTAVRRGKTGRPPVGQRHRA